MDILFLSRRIFLGDTDDLINGGILVTTEGKIRTILRTAEEVNSFMYNHEAESVIDFENKVLMPGLIDANVHINEPGRTDWEGFKTGTKAAAAGGFTTIIDMPIYCIPTTTTSDNFKVKAATARGKIYIDVGFWGGITSDNANENQINALARCGVVGFYCTLCPSQVKEFSKVDRDDIKNILNVIENIGAPLAFHAELLPSNSVVINENEPKKYKTFLDSRPSSMETAAVELITKLALEHKSVKIHISNLSSSETISSIENCKQNGGKLTVETCPHYLALNSDEISDAQTEFKCCPPIRNKENQNNLWKGIINNNIDMITSNHAPTLPGLKCLTYGRGRGDFVKAWSGIASLQFALSVFWTECQNHGLGMKDVYRVLCKNPAKLCGIDNVKSVIKEDFDADFCVWDPDEEFTVDKDDIYFQNKSNPYMNQKLKGVVHATVVRGLHVYEKYVGFGQPLGRVILRKPTKQVVKFN